MCRSSEHDRRSAIPPGRAWAIRYGSCRRPVNSFPATEARSRADKAREQTVPPGIGGQNGPSIVGDEYFQQREAGGPAWRRARSSQPSARCINSRYAASRPNAPTPERVAQINPLFPGAGAASTARVST